MLIEIGQGNLPGLFSFKLTPRLSMNRLFVTARAFGWTLVVVHLCGLMGCGKAAVPTGRVSGKVTYKGQPVSLGTVAFRNDEKGAVAAAKLDSSGVYQLRFGGDFNVPSGDYFVVVTPPDVELPIASDIAKDPSKAQTPIVQPEFPNIPRKYRNPLSSGLKFQVKPGENTFDIDLKD